jgi:hypothetical protein
LSVSMKSFNFSEGTLNCVTRACMAASGDPNLRGDKLTQV